MSRLREVTTTALVEDALRGAQDFFSLHQLMAATGRSNNRVTAALHQLRKSRVAEVVVEADGQGWWFALPREEDIRHLRVEERTPETKPRRKRKPRPYTKKEIV
jgi:hypothetical protein